MGKSVVIGSEVKSFLSSTASPTLGILIGTCLGAERSVIVRLVRTPCSATPKTDAEPTTPPKKKTPAVDPKPTALLLEWTPQLISQHARKVIRMLPGGLDILGLFVIHTHDVFQGDNLSHLKELMRSILKVQSRPYHTCTLTNSDRLVFHVNSSNQKVTCKSIDVADPSAYLKSVDYKNQVYKQPWLCMEAVLSLEIPMFCTKKPPPSDLLKHVKSGLSPWVKAVESSLVLINHRLISEESDALLDDFISSSVDDVDEVDDGFCEDSIHVDLVIEPIATDDGDENPDYLTVSDYEAGMMLRGIVHGRAYAPKKSKARDVVKFIKTDLLRSLLTRFEIHFQDLLVIEEEQRDPIVVHEPPTRIFASLPDTRLTVCDYIFPGERPEDALEAFNELLGMEITADDISVPVEKPAEPTALDACSDLSDGEHFSSSADTPPSPSPLPQLQPAVVRQTQSVLSPGVLVLIGVSGLVAILAIIFGVYTLVNKK